MKKYENNSEDDKSVSIQPVQVLATDRQNNFKTNNKTCQV